MRSFYRIRRSNDQDSYSDYEDIELQPGAGTPDVVLIGTPSESSDSVEIVEELCVFPTQKETQTRPATPPRRPVAPRRPRATIPKTVRQKIYRIAYLLVFLFMIFAYLNFYSLKPEGTPNNKM